jgi:hypothetical protein
VTRLGLIVGLVAIAATGCADKTDPEWQLDHDRLVAVRASAPHLAPGEQATFDALVAHEGAPTDVEQALGIAVFAPQDLSAIASGTTVTAPDAATLAKERVELGLDAGAPVPVDLVMQFPDSNGLHLAAKKTIYLGDSLANAASVGAVTVDGAPVGATVTVAIGVDVPLAVDAADDATVAWLTSVGTMHDDDEHAAFVHVEKTDDPLQGELAVVVRDASGGVTWQVWPIAAQ